MGQPNKVRIKYFQADRMQIPSRRGKVYELTFCGVQLTLRICGSILFTVAFLHQKRYLQDNPVSLFFFVRERGNGMHFILGDLQPQEQLHASVSMSQQHPESSVYHAVSAATQKLCMHGNT
jgi:hypothetical protein